MRRVIYSAIVSLDGFIEDANGSIDWSAPDAELHQHFNDQERGFAVVLYGRRMYEIMASFWPTADESPDATPVEIEFARIWRDHPKLVFSKTLAQVGWNSRLVRGDVVEEVRRLKAQPGGDIGIGGALLAGALNQHGLIDEFRIYVQPVLLGGGKPWFMGLPDGFRLKLIETRTFGSRVVMLHYQPAGAGQAN